VANHQPTSILDVELIERLSDVGSTDVRQRRDVRAVLDSVLRSRAVDAESPA